MGSCIKLMYEGEKCRVSQCQRIIGLGNVIYEVNCLVGENRGMGVYNPNNKFQCIVKIIF